MTKLAPDAIFTGGTVLTLDSRGRTAEALAVVEGKIAALGTTREMRALAGSSTRRHDLGGGTVIPGFNDAHCHVLAFGLSLLQVNLKRTTRIAELVAAVRARVRTTAAGGWVRGHGYNDNKLAERRHPRRVDLDAVSPAHPVWLQHTSGHMGVANSIALREAGLTRDTPDPQGGTSSGIPPASRPGSSRRRPSSS